MDKRKVKYGANLLKVAVAAFFCTGLFVNCAHVGQITGGPKDTLPPVVVRMKPESETRNFTGRTIFVEFDEYVALKDLTKEFYTSPVMKRKPSVTIKGKGVRIDIQDTLRPNTTYAFNFGGSIVDNHEGNPLNGFRYVFSTGSEIDSMVMSGYTVSAQKGDSVGKTFIYFFDAALDSVPAYDSVLFKNSPEVIGRAENNGIFIARNLKPKGYRIYAVLDNNLNNMYDAGIDMVGFLDSVCNPVDMPDFGVWFDTTRMYQAADPQVYFRMFLDERPARQTLSQASRPQQHKLLLVFSAPYPSVDSLTFENIDKSMIITEYLKPTRDSVALWLDIPSEQLPDTIKGRITYMRHDSLNVLVPHTQNLSFGWKKFESREEERERLRREKEAEKALREGLEAPKEENPFKYNIAGTPVNPDRNITFMFDYPLTMLDSLSVVLSQGEDEESFRRVAASWVQDTMNLRQWTMKAAWNPGQKYLLTIPPGAFTNVAGQTNDSISRSFETLDPDKFATLKVKVTGKTPESKYILQLTAEGGKLIEEIPYAATGDYTFRYVDPGKVSIIITEDMNGNGRWDVGNLVRRRQPERVETYMHAPGDPFITTRAGWQEDITLDMARIFEPVSIDRIREKLELEEERRLERIREEIEKRRKEKPKKERSQPMSNPTMDFMRGSGLSIPGMR